MFENIMIVVYTTRGGGMVQLQQLQLQLQLGREDPEEELGMEQLKCAAETFSSSQDQFPRQERHWQSWNWELGPVMIQRK